MATPLTLTSTMRPSCRVPPGAMCRMPGIQSGSALIRRSAALTSRRRDAERCVRASSASGLRYRRSAGLIVRLEFDLLAGLELSAPLGDPLVESRDTLRRRAGHRNGEGGPDSWRPGRAAVSFLSPVSRRETKGKTVPAGGNSGTGSGVAADRPDGSLPAPSASRTVEQAGHIVGARRVPT